MSLTGQHALITGGSRGIGFACAKKLCTLGARVSIVARDAGNLQKALTELTSLSPHVEGFRCDVTDALQREKVVGEILEKRGPVTILVNNAGGAESVPFGKTSLSHFEHALNLNFLSAVALTKLCLPALQQSSMGRIVNIASTAGLKGYPYVSAYCAAKHALVGFTRALALELAAGGVTVNAVCPGFTNTDMLRSAMATVSSKTGQSMEDIKHHFSSQNPLGRLIEPIEVASAVAWLCEPAQRAVTGQVIVIAGGEVV